jgi:predicted metal-dependent phosphoesterase TrpH
MQESRRDRNRRLSARLAELGVHVSLDEVEAVGRNMAGRPHFARIMVEKGYVSHYREAFDRYLDEAAPGYVHRLEPDLKEGIRLVQEAGGITSLAHPIRLGRTSEMEEEELIASMVGCGLDAIEAYHSDQDETATERYLKLARKYGLLVTGGSDFHGANKPSVQLGTGPGALAVPASLLATLRARGARRRSTPSPMSAPQPE